VEEVANRVQGLCSCFFNLQVELSDSCLKVEKLVYQSFILAALNGVWEILSEPGNESSEYYLFKPASKNHA
jgi:hypothetical protein